MGNTKTSSIEKEDFYLQRFNALPQQIFEEPKADLGLIVVIPSFKEPNIIPTLQSLQNCKVPPCDWEVIVVINAPFSANEEIKQVNTETIQQINTFLESNPQIPIHIINQLIPDKHAGVGSARKIGMDEAYRRFLKINNTHNGIISCFDADSTCQDNYLIEIYRHFQNSEFEACSINYKHDYDTLDNPEHMQAIINYELHLRYYILALKYAGHRHAYQTIGSSMAVKAAAYAKEGGMNRKKAGEDFYFLMKYIQKDQLSELHTTTIHPSCRTSDRVPFGTGRAMLEIQEGSTRYSHTYDFRIFIDLKAFLDQVPSFYNSLDYRNIFDQSPTIIKEYFKEADFVEDLQRIRDQSKSLDQFKNKFFRWFNGFQVMKFVHFARDNEYPNTDISSSCIQLIKFISPELLPPKIERKSLLNVLRDL